jgi:hypothetical protein
MPIVGGGVYCGGLGVRESLEIMRRTSIDSFARSFSLLKSLSFFFTIIYFPFWGWEYTSGRSIWIGKHGQKKWCFWTYDLFLKGRHIACRPGLFGVMIHFILVAQDTNGRHIPL